MCTDILEFRARGLVILPLGSYGRAALSPNSDLLLCSRDGTLIVPGSRRTDQRVAGHRLSEITRPRRWPGIARRPPIGWPQCGLDVRQPRAPSGLLEPASPLPTYISAGACPRNAE